MPANLHHAQEYLRRQLDLELRSSRSPHESGGQEADPVRQPQGSLSAPFGAKSPPCSAQDGSPADAQGDSIVNVDFVSTIEDAVRDADLAIDCVPDELESKLEILWLLDRMAPPRTVFATPTTRLSIADLAACTYRPEKCIAIAAEASTLAASPGSQVVLSTTAATSPETLALVERFWRRLGFAPVFISDPVGLPPQ